MTTPFALLRTATLGAFALGLAAAASAQEASETGAFEQPYGLTNAQAERAYEARGLRDANGNLTVVNGRIQTAGSLGFGLNTEWGQTDGFGSGSGTAIGNQLNVVVQGSNNTVIVDSTQINNGNQTTILNGGLDLND
jgi:holdfast attachment protein HfaA